MRFFYISATLLIAMFFQSSPVIAGNKFFSGKTFVFYERSHGIQVEHFSGSGRVYLWYPGNRGVVKGRWRTKKGSQICFQYGQNTYNPVTRKRGGRWQCRPEGRLKSTMKYGCNGDIFNLSSGKIPFVLRRHKFGLARLKAKCGGSV